MEGGGYLNYYLTGCAAQGRKLLPNLRIFLPQKRLDFVCFFLFLKFLQIGTYF